MDKIVDLVSGVPPKVPPFRMINHQINLIDRSVTDSQSVQIHLRKSRLRKSPTTPALAGGYLLWYSKPFPCYAFSRRTANCEQYLICACRMKTPKRMYCPFRTKIPYGMTLCMLHTDPNWICQRHINKYVFILRMSQRQPL